MGGLGKKMPFTRVVFIIGALARLELPIATGSGQELILEAGLKYSPIWMYILMLVGAGITAFIPSAWSGWCSMESQS